MRVGCLSLHAGNVPYLKDRPLSCRCVSAGLKTRRLDVVGWCKWALLLSLTYLCVDRLLLASLGWSLYRLDGFPRVTDGPGLQASRNPSWSDTRMRVGFLSLHAENVPCLKDRPLSRRQFVSIHRETMITQFGCKGGIYPSQPLTLPSITL
jgi:hypothetical protein